MRKQKLIKNFVSIIIISFLFNNISFSHSGKTNSKGCHNDTKNKSYHCHGENIKNEKKTNRNLKVIDGDTIHIGSLKYRFSGIDAPEKNQICLLSNVKIKCGILASEKLKEKIGLNTVKCKKESIDRYKRIVAECFVNNESLSSYLVKNGYAFAYRKYSKKFILDEDYARLNKKGLWAMKFEFPWDHRKNN
jgi:endonuclease YncB( thermonuclease family)